MNTDFPIKRFLIYSLFGKYDVNLNFENPINIYIGENGIGKTTILNCIYNILSRNFSGLLNINFSRIEIHMDNDIFSFSKSDSIELENISNIFGSLDNIKIEHNGLQVIKNKLKRKERNLFEYALYSNFIKYENKGNDFDIIKKAIAFFDRIRKYNILYFPTYRRIEEDLLKISPIEKNKDLQESLKEAIESGTSLIKFGMDDVDIYIKNIMEKIRTTTIAGFSDLTTALLIYASQELKYKENISTRDMEFITSTLDRFCAEHPTDYHIRSNMTVSDILIDNIRHIEGSQRVFDQKINDFTDTCNRYLVGKQFYYDKKKIELKIKDDNGKEIKLSHLSSGEKQIVSIFSKIYLSENKSNIILFDEPELSLSIFWQRKLLVDIVKSKKCDFLISTTHSPFIFENELQEYTHPLFSFIKNKR